MTLQLNIQREVKPREVASLIYGTGGMSWGSWWQGATWIRPDINAPDARHVIKDAWDDAVKLEETDVVELEVDDPEEPEGSGKTITRLLTLEQIIDAAAKLIREGYADDESRRDMAQEDLGYADAIAADCVLQLAVFGELVYG